MRIIGLTGSIGSGKSTVSALLEHRGALVIDTDLIAREVVEIGSPGLGEIVAEFGSSILHPDGTLDRSALAHLAFGDPSRLAVLNAILHPLIGRAVVERLRRVESSGFDGIVLLVVPLLAEVGRDRYPIEGVIVVDVDPEVAVRRLVASRGMSESDARSRLAAQATTEERHAIADWVVSNSGSEQDLRAELDALWTMLGGVDPPDGL